MAKCTIVVSLHGTNVFVDGLGRGSVHIIPVLKREHLTFGCEEQYWLDTSKLFDKNILIVRNQKGDMLRKIIPTKDAQRIVLGEANEGLMKPCIGLFGTCGRSRWRDEFVKTYEDFGINYFNPVVPDWTPECSIEEARHLASDRVILFPITRETYSLRSLAESGFSLLNAIDLDDRRQFVLLVDTDLDEDLMGNKEAAKGSIGARALVLEHLKRKNFSNVYLVDNLKDMLQISIELYWAEEKFVQLRELIGK